MVLPEALLTFRLAVVLIESPILNPEVGGGGGTETLIVVDCEIEPPGPVQSRVYVEVVVGVVDSVLEVPLTPVHPPEAVQEVALVELQVSVEELPWVIDDGEADKDRVGLAKETVTDLLIDPPVALSLQVKVYVLFTTGETASLPDSFLAPVHASLAVQLVELVDCHARVAEDPGVIIEGEAEKDNVIGETITDVETPFEPFAPVHFTP